MYDVLCPCPTVTEARVVDTPMQIVEVSDVFWEEVARAARGHEVNRLVNQSMFPLSTSARPMLTGETIALPLAYFLSQSRPTDSWTCDEMMQCEYVFDDVTSMLKRVLQMYEDAAALMPESPRQCRRRQDLRMALRRYS